MVEYDFPKRVMVDGTIYGRRPPLPEVFIFDGEEFRAIPSSQMNLACSESGRFVGKTGKILTPRKQTSGYLWYSWIDEDRVYSNTYAHRGVAEVWLEPRPGAPFVNHKDGNKHNNAASNLEWCTPAENTRHAIETGLSWNIPRKGEMGFRRMTRAQNRQVQAKLWREQGGVCPICGETINLSASAKENGPVTDHVHNEEGAVRAVLHRGCNGFLGKAEGTTRWAGVSPSDNDRIADLLISAGHYLMSEPTHIQYYTVRTPEEQAQAQKLKARKARARRKARETIK